MEFISEWRGFREYSFAVLLLNKYVCVPARYFVLKSFIEIDTNWQLHKY